MFVVFLVVVFGNVYWKVPGEIAYLNVASKTEHLFSFDLLEIIHFQEIFHWIDIWNIVYDIWNIVYDRIV